MILPKPLSAKKKLFLQARNEYYNSATGATTLTDAEFDILEDQIRKLDPEWKELQRTGISAGKKKEIPLVCQMPSLDKIQAENPEAVNKFLSRISKLSSNVELSEKLDGCALQAVYVLDKKHSVYVMQQLITRGDGVLGKDVSYFIPHLKNVPVAMDLRPALRSTLPEKIVVRMEAVIRRKDFNEKWATVFDSARAAASAIFNRHDVHAALADVRLVAIRVQYPYWSIKAGREFLKCHEFEVVRSKTVRVEECTVESLTASVERIRESSKYDTDGLVLWTSCMLQDYLEDTEKRPQHARAFKLNDIQDAKLTTITRVDWQPSPHGYLIPKAQIEPLKFGAVTVKQVTLNNANWAHERGLGVGAQVKVLRSGEIIPKIVAVVKSAKFQLPSSKEVTGSYEWDKTHTHLVLASSVDNKEVVAKKFNRFFTSLGMEDIAIGVATKLADAGFTSTAQLANLQLADFASLPGVKSSAAKYAEQVQRIRDCEFDMISLMVASGVFPRGVGETRLRSLAAAVPTLFNIKTLDESEKLRYSNYVEAAAETKGCGPAFAEALKVGLPAFARWLAEADIEVRAVKKESKVIGPLTGKSFSWTGYRDKQQERIVEDLGGRVVAFSVKKTSVLFYQQGSRETAKPDKARESGIPVISNFAKWLDTVKD
jgi:NAD-dependent DNA ligase